jgi:hypothetical protein
MIEKVDNINIVPEDIKELLMTEKGEYIVIGDNVYILKPFNIKKYFEILHFISTYFSSYNETFSNMKDENNISEFIGCLSKRILENDLIEEFMKSFFPDIPNASNDITKKQLDYLLGAIYKLNFLSKPLLIKNQEMKLSIQRMQIMLGLNLAQ